MKRFILLSVIIISISSCSKQPNTLFSKIPEQDSGLSFNNRIIENDTFNILTTEYIFNGGGVAVGDFNNDLLPDLFFSGNQVPNKLFINEGDLKFTDTSIESGIEAKNKWNTGISTIDINNDGWLDLYICSAMLTSDSEKENLLFVNQGLNKEGIPTFKEVAKEYGIADIGNSMHATFFDYDNDGHLDLYVLNNVDIHELPSNYRTKITDGSALSNDKLYHNNGDNTFTDVTVKAGITIEGYGLGIAISDLNYDGWQDIYISNDYLTNDILYINNEDGTFSNKISKLIKHQSKFSMGNDISDFNNDGFLDIITLDMLGETNYRLKTTIRNTKYFDYVNNEKYDYDYQYSRNMLQLGHGQNIPFQEIGLMAGVARTDWSWSPLFADMDNDGHKDLLITNGFPRDITDLDFGEFNYNVRKFLKPIQILDSIPVVKIPNYAYKNKTNGQFQNVSDKWGLSIPSFSNGAVFADLDNDGDLDYVVNNINDFAFLFKNNLNTLNQINSNFLRVNLKGAKENKFGLGSKLVLRFTDGSFQYYEHHLNRGYMSSVQDIAHFGVGANTQIESLEVLWPDGKFQLVKNVPANQTIEVDYKKSKDINLAEVSFPFKPKTNASIFNEVSNNIGVRYMHEEVDKIDYNVQPVLPHKLTQNGPCLVKGDVNGDGFEDFIVGSAANYSPQIYLQDSKGNFNSKPLFNNPKQNLNEEEDMILFDLENDGDLDLYLVSGSLEFDKKSGLYKDKLMINDGTGNFQISTDKIPNINTNGSVVAACDYNHDGFVDLFIGGRTPFAQFPKAEPSFILKNDNGILINVTNSIAKELNNVGMITDATWQDIDGDGLIDLVIIGELMSITIFKNKNNEFRRISNTGIDSLHGWWESIKANDFDKDGDIDFIVGNMGSNNLYQPTAEKPTTLVSKDFDNNDAVDPIMFAYFKNSFKDTTHKSFPVNFWGDLYGQSPLFRSKFKTYKAYANATQSTLFTPEEIEGVQTLIGNFDKSVYIENLGSGQFKYSMLPWQLQMAPINKIVISDINNDQNEDVLLVGNDYGNEIFIGRYDAFNGGLLRGNGEGDFEFIDTEESGFLVPEDAKDIISVKSANSDNPYFIVAQNRGKLLIFQKNETTSKKN